MLEQSSLSGTSNIRWTQKNPADTEKPKKTKGEKKTSTNIIYMDNTEIKPHVEKIFKIGEKLHTESRKKKTGKKFQTSSASNFKIIPGFSRKGR